MGLLHRGISPETVFITKTGSAKLSGYATLGLRTADSELKSQMFDGYAAPEQYAVAEFDGKYTDIYGLGALFYRVLTGKTPVPANLRRMNDTLPPAIRWIRKSRALSRRPSRGPCALLPASACSLRPTFLRRSLRRKRTRAASG